MIKSIRAFVIYWGTKLNPFWYKSKKPMVRVLRWDELPDGSAQMKYMANPKMQRVIHSLYGEYTPENANDFILKALDTSIQLHSKEVR